MVEAVEVDKDDPAVVALAAFEQANAVHNPDLSPQERRVAAMRAALAAVSWPVGEAQVRVVLDHYKSGLQMLACTFYKEDQHQDYAKHVLATAPALAVEPAKWKQAFAAQSRKLEAVLHIPGVKEALARLEWPATAPEEVQTTEH